MRGNSFCKIKKKTMLFLIILLLIILRFHCFYLFHYSGFIGELFSGRRMYVVLGIFALPLAFIVLFNDKTYNGNIRKKILFFLSIYIVSFFIECLYSWSAYKQSLSDVLSASSRLLVILYSIIFAAFFYREGGEKKLFKILNIIVTLYSIELIILSVIYLSTENIILDFETELYISGILSTRDGVLRIGISELGMITLVYNFYNIYYEKLYTRKKIEFIICFFIQLYTCVFIQQTRMWIIVLMVSMIAIIFSQKGKLKFQIIKASIVAGFSIFLFNGTIMQKIYSSFSLNGNYIYSTSARLYSIEYYMDCIKKNFVFGNGFTIENNSAIVHGPAGIANYSDVGFLGLMAETGMFSFVFYVLPMLFIISTLYKEKKRGIDDSLGVSLLVMLLGSSFTLIFTDMQRIIGFSLVLGLFLYKRVMLINLHRISGD